MIILRILKPINRMNKFFLPLVIFSFLILTYLPLQAQDGSDNTTIDQIVAVVNNHIILQSEVDQQVREYLYQVQQQQNQAPSFSEDVWYTVLQNIVQKYVLLDKAAIDSVIVTEDQVDQRIDQQIQQTVQQMGSEQALKQRMGQSIVQIRADLREQYREQLTVQRYRQQQMVNIDITRPEVVEFFEDIPQDSLPTVPEQVAISQIVAVPTPMENARTEAKELAESLRDSIINHGKSIGELAEKYSDGPSASKGGKLPMLPLSDLVSEYSAAASALEPGQISEVVETSFGFHVIRLNERQGDKIDTNHILISVDEENYDDQSAINQLNNMRDSLSTNEDIAFSDLARQESEDPNTAPQGGRILSPQTGQRLLSIDELDPALYRIVLLLENKGDISDPKPFNIGTEDNSKRAFRIVRLDEHNPEHTANLEQDYQRIKQFALREKRFQEMQKWINKLKEEVYIEYKIPMPQKYAEL